MDQPTIHCPDEQGLSDAAAETKRFVQLLLTGEEAAALFGKSVRTWRSWDAAGLIPRPIRIGRSTLWRPEDLRAWVEAGCPRRKEWEEQQE